MAVAINRLESQVQGKLSSQLELNPKNVSAMTLRSGKEIQEPELVTSKDKDEKKIEKKPEAKSISSKDSEVLSDPVITVNDWRYFTEWRLTFPC